MGRRPDVTVELTTITAAHVIAQLDAIGSDGLTLIAKSFEKQPTVYMNLKAYYLLRNFEDKRAFIDDTVLYNTRYAIPDFMGLTILHSSSKAA